MKSSGRPDGAIFEHWGRGASHTDLNTCVWANTLNAHCLLHLAKEKYGWAGMHKLKQHLFEEYYEHNRNISLIEVLVQIWTEIFPDSHEREARDYLESSVAEREVLSEDAKAKSHGVKGVPSFTISYHQGAKGETKEIEWVKVDKAISGAQTHTMWMRVFSQMQDLFDK